MTEPMTTEQLLERLRALAEARAAGVVDETARIRFENACINTNFPALLEAVEGLVRDAERYRHIAGHAQMHSPKMDNQHSWRVTNRAVSCTGCTFDEAVDKSMAKQAKDFAELREVERLRAALFGPQKQPASVRQIEAQTKSVANQLAESDQNRDLTSKPHGDKPQEVADGS